MGATDGVAISRQEAGRTGFRVMTANVPSMGLGPSSTGRADLGCEI
jgi:hypothetical protein